jgi:hypothetical protein
LIPLLAPRTLTRLRYGAATVSGGISTRPTPTESDLVAAVQPAPRAVIDRLPDGAASRSPITVATYGELRGYAPDQYADRIRVPSGLDVEAGDYEVHDVERSPAFLGQPDHRVAVALKVLP